GPDLVLPHARQHGARARGGRADGARADARALREPRPGVLQAEAPVVAAVPLLRAQDRHRLVRDRGHRRGVGRRGPRARIPHHLHLRVPGGPPLRDVGGWVVPGPGLLPRGRAARAAVDPLEARDAGAVTAPTRVLVADQVLTLDAKGTIHAPGAVTVEGAEIR